MSVNGSIEKASIVKSFKKNCIWTSIHRLWKINSYLNLLILIQEHYKIYEKKILHTLFGRLIY